MSIDETMAEPWETVEEYFKDEGFEEKNFEIDAQGQGENMSEAADSLERSIYGTAWFEREDVELVFSYNPMTQDGTIKIERYESDEDIERYIDELEDELEANIEYSFGEESSN